MQNLLAVTAVFYISRNEFMKHKLINDITVYESHNIAAQIETVVCDYSCLWEDHDNIIDVFKSDWINISLLNNWQKKYKSEQVHVYSLELNDQTMINKTFDKLYQQNHIKWIISTTFFLFSCFIVWCILSDNTCKNCVVVNIKVLNKINMSNIYSMFSQTNILAAVQDVNYIFTVNCSAYFYQWCINIKYQHCLIISSHQDQRIFKIAVMNY